MLSGVMLNAVMPCHIVYHSMSCHVMSCLDEDQANDNQYQFHL